MEEVIQVTAQEQLGQLILDVKKQTGLSASESHDQIMAHNEKANRYWVSGNGEWDNNNGDHWQSTQP